MSCNQGARNKSEDLTPFVASSISPRYKERLQLKYLKHSKLSTALEGGRWTFMAGNIDDFRSGVPAETKGTDMVQRVRLRSILTFQLLSLLEDD